jgi:Zn-dependent protease/CBS domain-containing protein
MFGNRIRLGTILGFEIFLDLSWLILAFLITWTLAVGYFPTALPGLPAATYWWMGVTGALGLFASIVFHELGHSVVARKYDIPIKGITLFIFGGVAEMTKEPPNAKSELWMALAGPFASVIASLFFLMLHWTATLAGWPIAVIGLMVYLSSINLIFAIFNMVPAFPLDGGRVLRALLWNWKNDLAWATRIASSLGGAFGLLLIVLGLLTLFGGNFIGGIWWAILGMFIRGASKSSYQQVLLRQLLEGEPVRKFMSRDPVTVPSSTTLRQLVDRYIYQHHHKFFPVVDDGNLLGCITLRHVKQVPDEEWNRRTVSELATPCEPGNTLDAGVDAMDALTNMYGTNTSRMMVTENGRLAGILSLKDLMSFLALKLEIEGDKPLKAPRASESPRGRPREAH